MKSFLIVVLSFASSVAMADGFRCQGQNFRVQMYNQTQPTLGTRNPAALVVYERGVGTVAVLENAEIIKTNGDETVTYEGQANGRQDGRFVYVRLEVAKGGQTAEDGSESHEAHLVVNSNGDSSQDVLTCQRYLKLEQR